VQVGRGIESDILAAAWRGLDTVCGETDHHAGRGQFAAELAREDCPRLLDSADLGGITHGAGHSLSMPTIEQHQREERQDKDRQHDDEYLDNCHAASRRFPVVM